MTIRVRAPGEDAFKEAAAKFASAWETGDYMGEELVFATLDQLLGVVTPKRWVIIDRLQKTGPSSLRALARALHRDVKRVHQDVGVLIEEGVVERNADGKIEVPFKLVVFEARISSVA